MKINHKITVVLVSAVLLAALEVGVLFWSFSQIEKTAEAHSHAFMVVNKGDDFLSTLKDAETGQRGYLLTGDDSFLEPYQSARDRVSAMLKALRQITAITAAQKHLDAIVPLMDAKMAEMSQLITLRRNQNMNATTAAVRVGHGKRLMDGIRVEMQSFMQIEEGALRQHEAEYKSKMHLMFSIIVISSLLTMLLALSFAYLLYRASEQRLKNAVFLETEHLLKLQEEANTELQRINVALQEKEETTQRLFSKLEIYQIEVEEQNTELRRAQTELETQQVELELQNDEMRITREELEAQQVELELQNDEMRMTREELEVSRDKYAELYDLAPVGYFTFNQLGVIREVNRSGAQLLEVEQQLLTDRPFAPFIADPEERALFSHHLEAVFSKEGMQKCEIRFTGKEGAEIHGQFQSIVVDSAKNNGRFIISSVVDGTTGKQLEKEIQDAREYAENIVETVREPLLVLSSDLKILTANHSFYETFNVTAEDTIGYFIYDLGNRQWDIPKLRTLVEEILPENNVMNNYEVEHDFPGIGRRTILLNARQIFRENISSHIILLAMEDITERKKLEHELQKSHTKLGVIVDERTKELIWANEQKLELSDSNRLLVEVSRSKSDFLANMSHELRTPLNSVIGFSEVLLDELFGPINEQQKEYTENILYSGKHLLSLINDILDLAKVESGKMELELDTFSLRETLGASLMMFKEKAQKAQVELNLELATEADVEITADQRKLKQIVFNLLSNAIKFTQAGGNVNVRARLMRDEGGELCNSDVTQPSSLNSQHNRNFIEISVEDTGIGIKTEDMPKLFKAFTQLESAYTKKHEGTGIGLVLSRQLVELHGGRIWLESELGVGSRFTFTIPLRQEGAEDSACSGDENVMRLNPEYDKRPEEVITMPRKILIVEDNANNRSLFRDILTFHGYEVSEAIDGQDGVDQARKLMPDLILMDIQMPGMDGLTAGSILKSDPATATLKIIALTSFAMQGDREKFLEAGFDGYLSKPINTRELPDLILHWLDEDGPS